MWVGCGFGILIIRTHKQIFEIAISFVAVFTFVFGGGSFIEDGFWELWRRQERLKKRTIDFGAKFPSTRRALFPCDPRLARGACLSLRRQ